MRLKARPDKKALRTIVCCLVLGLTAPGMALAHCDTMDGPVVLDAKQALEKGEVTPVLKWVNPDNEAEIRATFKQTLAVRGKGKDVKDLADRYFFETLVRLHRQGEGEPYTGLKPVGTDPGPGIKISDQALQTRSADDLVKIFTEQSAAGIRERFKAAVAKKSHADDSVQAGREFVNAYVEFIHYVERLFLDVQGPAAHHHVEAGAVAAGGDRH